jgi:hypothetical protein
MFWHSQAWLSSFKVFSISLWMLNAGGLAGHFIMQVGAFENIVENF